MIAAGWFIAGLLLWSFLEYLIHRWIGHVWNTRLRLRHLEHHADPLDYRYEPLWTLIGLILITAGYTSALWVACAAAGTFLGYSYYEWRHQRLHVSRQWSYHTRHHAHPRCNFGVTTTLWDRAFGTLR